MRRRGGARKIDWSAYLVAERVRGSRGVVIDIHNVVQSEGIHIVRCRLEKGIYGIAIVSHGLILVNTLYGRCAERFTLAHELSEFFKSGVTETWRNEFAAHLLVPMNDLFWQFEMGNASLASLGRRYDVGERVIRFQLRYLNQWIKSDGIRISA